LKEVAGMCEHRMLDVDNVARIGLMFLDGDKLEQVLLDKLSTDYDDINYHHEYFRDLKTTLTKIERINPNLKLFAILWQLRPDNDNLAVPVIVGNSLPIERWFVTPLNEGIRKVFKTGEPVSFQRSETACSYYYPVRNSGAGIAGVLELLDKQGKRGDI
jgi:hypothetical protein